MPSNNTRESLAKQLRALGVSPGMTLMVHTSLSKVGWIVGGAHAMVEALLDVLGPKGTLVMPAASPQLAPRDVSPTEGKPSITFLKQMTPTTMGALAECFRTWP